MTVYVDKLNYEANGQCWNVDFSRLPPSEQNDALAALHQPLVPESLVLLTSLQNKYPLAFERVSALTTLPAPDLSQPMTPWGLMTSVSMLMAFLNAKMMEVGIDASAQGRENAVKLSNAEIGLATETYREQLDAAWKNAAGAIASGVVSMGAGLGSFGLAGKSFFDSRAQNKSHADVGAAKRETENYQRQMEHNAKDLEAQAQARRTDAQRLEGYANEADSSTGLSHASRQNVDDEIAAKNAQVKDCQAQKDAYQSSMLDARHRSEDLTLSDAQRNAAKKELDDLVAGKDRVERDLDERIKGLKADVEALDAIKRLDDNQRQIKVDGDRLMQLQQQGVRTQAEDQEMQTLQSNLPQRAKAVGDDRGAAQARIGDLRTDAKRQEDFAKELRARAQDHVGARQAAHAGKEAAIGQDMDRTKNIVTAGSAGAQAIGASGQAVGAIPQMEGQEHQAAADYLTALAKFFGVSREALAHFVDLLKQFADAAMQSTKDRADQENQVTKAVAGNMS